jgi:hypothetical protein
MNGGIILINPAWFFVFATVIAVFGILFAFKNMMAHVQLEIEKGQEIKIESMQQEQTRFFIKVALAEAIPILLIVYGFMKIGELTDQTYNISLPLLIIIGAYLFALVHIFLTKRDALGYDNAPTESKNVVNVLTMLGIALVSAIPIISVVAIFTMTG